MANQHTPVETIEESKARFFTMVNKTDTCWEWTGGRSKGYGHFWWKGRTRAAHRWIYELLVAPVPAELHMDHLCRNHRCVNPSHLEPVTPKENVVVSQFELSSRYNRLRRCSKYTSYLPTAKSLLWISRNQEARRNGILVASRTI